MLSLLYLVETLIKDLIAVPVIHFSYLTDIYGFWFFKGIHFPVALLNVWSNLITCNDFLITSNRLLWSCWSWRIWKIDIPKTEIFSIAFSWMIFRLPVLLLVTCSSLKMIRNKNNIRFLIPIQSCPLNSILYSQNNWLHLLRWHVLLVQYILAFVSSATNRSNLYRPNRHHQKRHFLFQ